MEQERTFCTIKEAMQICGVRSTQGFRSLLGSFGLLQKVNHTGTPFLSRADMEVLGKIRPHLITKTDAGVMLGVSTGTAPRLLDLLCRAGHLQPFMAGPKPAQKTFRFLKQDIEKLKCDLEKRCRKEPAPWRAVSICSGGDNRVAARYLCQALLSGVLTEAWWNLKEMGLRGIRVSKAEAERLSQMSWQRWESELKPLEAFVPSMEYWRERAKDL